MKQKHFMDIERLKEGTEDTLSKKRNCDGFEVGDMIQITEKWDGSNASICYDKESGKLLAFSRRRELNEVETLSGFFNYVRSLDADDYHDADGLVIFGEWGVKNAIQYFPDNYKKWYVYDIYDKNSQCWMPQEFVKKFAAEHGLTYIHVLYEGPFVSWDHCRSFCHSPAYGDMQEGVVIKNQTKLNNSDSRLPFVLKIVNEQFCEVKKSGKPKSEKQADSDVKAKAQAILETIVTESRVRKKLMQLKEDGILPEELTVSSMEIVAKNLPKLVYDDCVKEENDIVIAAGEYAGKICGQITMQIARKIIIGGRGQTYNIRKSQR